MALLNEKDVSDIIAAHMSSDAARYRKLGNYYRGIHPVLQEQKQPGKPDNRLVCNFCKSITDSTVGYFMGKPLTFSCADGMDTVIGDINAYNDEQFAESALARDLSVYGKACEILYIDADRLVRFTPADISGVIALYGGGIERELTAAVRLCEAEGGSCAELYDSQCVSLYKYSRDSGVCELISQSGHCFGQVPVNFYKNNADGMGDFEPVLSLVDAYNRLQSQSLDDFELFADSYLAITGMSGTRSEDIEALRRERVLLLDNGGGASWLTKTVNDGYIEHLKSRIARDIYRFSGTVDLSEEVLGGGQLSGAAIRYRMTAFENRVSVTERYFKKALQRRYELICAALRATGHDYDYRGIEVTFNRNLPDVE